MSEEIITQRGKKTPQEAFDLFCHRDYSAPNKIAVLNQLNVHAPFLAHEAAAWVKRQPALQGETKLHRVADEVLSGLPIGEKRLATEEAVLKFLQSIPQGSRVRVTFGEKKINALPELLAMAPGGKYFSISSEEVMFLVSCVIPSGRWEGIPRTYSILIGAIPGTAAVAVLAHYLFPCIESIELVYTQQQFVAALTGTASPAKAKLDSLVRKYPEVEYDKDLFIDTMTVLGFPQAVACTESFAPNEPMANVTSRFGSDFTRLEFFKAYALKFHVLMAM